MRPRGGSRLRFTPGEFQYNGRITAALLPSLLVLAGFGGRIPASIGLVGAMVAYILDATRYMEGALGAIWLTMGLVNMSLWFSQAGLLGDRPIAMSLMIAACSGITLFLTGIWATLQFKWIQMRYPVVVLAFEKLLLATAFVTAATVQAWGLIAAVGAAHACFYLMIILCILYHLLALPLNTSFHVRNHRDSAIGGKLDEELRIQSPLEAGCAALLLTFLPGMIYSFVHLSVLSESKHLWSVLLLFSVPAFFLSIVEEGLWWMPCSKQTRGITRQLLCLGSLGASLAAVEGRLVFPAFGQYIALHPPWSYLLVTVALYGFAAIVIVFFSGVLSGVENSSLAGSILLVSALLGSFAAGLPISVIPAPMFAAGGLALFLQSREMKDYVFFVLGAACTMAWFIHHHFWFLEINMQELSLQSVCVLIWVTMLPALSLPGLYLASAPRALCSALLIAQAILLTFLEEHLYIGVDEVEGEIYPAGMVLLTSSLGLLAAKRLKLHHKMGKASSWILSSILAAKVSMLVLPQARLVLPAIFLALAVSAPILLEFGGQIPGKGSPAVPPWQPLVCGLGTLAAVLNARNAIYDLLHYYLGQRPSEGLLFGVILLALGLGLVPLLGTALRGRRDPKRVVGLILAFGLLLAVMRPPLPYKGGAECPGWLPEVLCHRFWDAAHRPNDGDDISIWGEYGEEDQGWLSWILIGAALSILGSVSRPASHTRKAFRSLLPLTLSGLGMGVYLALEFFPEQTILQIIVTLGIGSLAAFLFGLRLRGVASPVLLAFLLSIWALTFPLSVTVRGVVPLPPLPQRALRLFPDSTILVEEQRHTANKAALLALYSAESVLLAFAMKLRIAGSHAPVEVDPLERNSSAAQLFRMGNMYADSAAKFLGQCFPDTGGLQGLGRQMSSVSAGLRQLDVEGLVWLPTAANMITLFSFTMSLVLARFLEQDTDTFIFVLSPILLLLNQDRMWPLLTSKTRYLPPCLAISIYLSLSSISQILPLLHNPRFTLVGHDGYTVTFLKNLWLAGFALPGHFTFNQYLWDRTEVTAGATLLISALDIVAIAFSNLTVIKLLAVSALAMSLAQNFSMWRTRTEGIQLI